MAPPPMPEASPSGPAPNEEAPAVLEPPPKVETPPQRVEPSTKKTFTVTLKKTPEQARLGISVDASNKVALLVASVDGGMMADWNKNNPANAVQENDAIVNVNGKAGDAMSLTDVCRNDTVLVMQVVRQIG